MMNHLNRIIIIDKTIKYDASYHIFCSNNGNLHPVSHEKRINIRKREFSNFPENTYLNKV